MEELKTGDHLNGKSLKRLGLISILAHEEDEKQRQKVVLVCFRVVKVCVGCSRFLRLSR